MIFAITGCISHIAEDFIGELRDSGRVIKGFGGTKNTGIKIGTLLWKWCDNEGQEHKFKIPNSFYIPQGGVRLLSPQHWVKAQGDRKPVEGTGETTNSKEVILYWNQHKHRLTIPLSVATNVATFRTAPGYRKFDAFCAEAGFTSVDDEEPLLFLCQEANLISDDEDDDEPAIEHNPAAIRKEWGLQSPGPTIRFHPDTNIPAVPNSRERSRANLSTPTPTLFNLDGPNTVSEGAPLPNVVIDKEDRLTETAPAELLRYHHQFSHAPFKKLQELAKCGVIPKRLAKCQIPVCSACMFAKATKKKWRDKTRKNEDEPEKVTEPGQVVSVDQMVSPTPGLIAQITGILTSKRYTYATVFVDQYSRFSYVHLQNTATAAETIEAKKAFERYAKDSGIMIRAYHADNGVFRANDWVAACRGQAQALTFAAVGAHHPF
eukprot:scaffold111925_cov48-Attheya_sp.AAC.1